MSAHVADLRHNIVSEAFIQI